MNTRMALALSLVTTLSACNDPAEAPPKAPFPEWVLGHWIWEGESTQESALAIVDGYLERGIEVAAIVIDSPWATGYSTFVWDPLRFPDPQVMIDTLHEKGVRVLLWTVPGINIDVQPLYDEAKSKGYFMQYREGEAGPAVVGWWKGDGSLLDYFNPEAVEWWHAQVDQALAYGIDGWKTDGLDFSAIVASYSPYLGRQTLRPEYSHQYYDDFYFHTRDTLGDDRVIMARPVDNYGLGVGGLDVAFARRTINFAGWVGDQDASFEGMAAALNNMWQSSALAYLIVGSDVGGYRTDDAAPEAWGRTRELFVRWTQLGAFSGLFENGGGGEHRPWMFDDEVLGIYQRYARLREAMRPYLLREAAVAWERGEPLMRFVESNVDVDPRYDYFLGRDVFVAPLTSVGGARQVTLPEGGEWRYLFDATRHFAGGETFTLSCALASYPIFVRVGSDVEDVLIGVLKGS